MTALVERTTFTATPGYLALNSRPIFSASSVATWEMYQVRLPSRLAASYSCASWGDSWAWASDAMQIARAEEIATSLGAELNCMAGVSLGFWSCPGCRGSRRGAAQELSSHQTLPDRRDNDCRDQQQAAE